MKNDFHNFDKDILRHWYSAHCDPYADQTLPEAPADLIDTLSKRYIQLYEKVTGNHFNEEVTDIPINKRIELNLQTFLR